MPNCHDFDGGRVLLVGDSHSYISGCTAYGGWDADATIGRTSSQGLWVAGLYLAPRHDRLVFDLATNDLSNPAQFRDNLRILWGSLLGERDLTLVTSYVPVNGTNMAKPVNDEIRAFCDAHPQRASVVDWAGYARSHGFVPADYVHFGPSEYAQRVDLIRGAVN